jgi:hypothetical protein
MPIARSALAHVPDPAPSMPLLHRAMAIIKSLSASASPLLHCGQLGTVHRWTVPGVPSEYHEPKNVIRGLLLQMFKAVHTFAARSRRADPLRFQC